MNATFVNGKAPKSLDKFSLSPAGNKAAWHSVVVPAFALAFDLFGSAADVSFIGSDDVGNLFFQQWGNPVAVKVAP